MSYYNRLQTQQISSAIKRANQRINQLAKIYGKDSSVYKQEVGKFLKGAYKPFVTMTSGKARGRNVAKALAGTYKAPESHLAFNVREIMKLVRSQGNTSQVQRMIAEIAGMKFDAEGNPKQIKGAGIPTVSELTKRTEKKLERWGEDPGDYSKKELQGITEQLAQFSESFQTAYNEYIANFGESEARKDSTIKTLYGEFRNKRLTYRELEQIKQRMEEANKAATSEALQFEKDNT